MATSSAAPTSRPLRVTTMLPRCWSYPPAPAVPAPPRSVSLSVRRFMVLLGYRTLRSGPRSMVLLSYAHSGQARPILLTNDDAVGADVIAGAVTRRYRNSATW